MRSLYAQPSRSPVFLFLAGIMLMLAFLHHLGEPFHHTRVVVGKEAALLFIQRGDGCHVLVRQGEIKYIEVCKWTLISSILCWLVYIMGYTSIFLLIQLQLNPLINYIFVHILLLDYSSFL